MKTLFAVSFTLLVLAQLGDALTFGAIGDWGLGGYPVFYSNGAAEPEVLSSESYKRQCKKLGCNFTIACGDNMYPPNVMTALKDSFADMFGKSDTGPWFPSIGNHDNWGPQVQYAKTNPQWRFDSRYYSYKMPIDNTGYAIEVFAVDTTDGSLSGGAQYHWLENKLYESTARWKIIFGHYPTTGSGRHKRIGSVMSLWKLMQRFSVQAYFYGHDHIVEVSNGNGGIHGLTGGMARGGMMLFPIGGDMRKFTITSPVEYDPDHQPWPPHGYHICDVSPNLMTCRIFYSSDNLGYEYTVTHDWIKKTQPPDGSKSELSEEERKNWPSAKIINKALRDEMTLAPGNETADSAQWSPSEGEGPNQLSPPGATVTPKPPTPAPTAVPGAPPTDAPTTPTPVKLNEILAGTPVPSSIHGELLHPAVFSVSTECEECHPTRPVANRPFTVTIQDYDVAANHNHKPHIFLSTSATGCERKERSSSSAEKRGFLTGSGGIKEMKGNSIVFAPQHDRAVNVYVCFDDGSSSDENFLSLRRINDPNEPKGFLLEAPVGVTQPLPSSGGVPVSVPAPGANPAGPPVGFIGTSAPAYASLNTPAPQVAGGDSGHSSITLVVVAVLCLGGGFGFSYYQQQKSSGGAARVARDESEAIE